jgi:Tol biopolymer transport system component
MKFIIGLMVLFSLGITAAQAQTQYFGQNKIQYEKFDWRYIQSEHFDVYFYEGGYDLARFTAEVAESAYVQIKADFNFDINNRIIIIVYKSHNQFQQTNVTYSFLDEGIGGFTELYKNRIVLPYEGSYDQFRHVIHHELVHAVMNDMLYGGSIQSLVSGSVAQVPLWFSEGMAEYCALRWDTRLDMVVRDATLTGYLPPIEFLDYFPYQGGASVFRYIAQKYGPEKIGEIMHKIKGSFGSESAFRSALGIDFKELTEEWQREMKREYWPDIADRKEPAEISKALTDHREEGNYLNSSPALSPQGDKLVFLSNMDGKMSVYLMDVLEGKVIRRLIKGESDVNFEELHFLEPGFSWSPDGKKITLAAKAGGWDALYIYDLQEDNYKQYKFDLDGIFSAAWSPKGNEIAFVGNKNGASDIYLFSLETGEITNVTNDVFSDSDPSWSPDGKRIAFVSDRGPYTDAKYSPGNFDMYKYNYHNEDIYIMNRDGSNMIRITDTPTRESSPIFAPNQDMIAYVAEESGVSNIYFHDLEVNERWPVTNLITGAFQLSWDRNAQRLAFSSFYRGGWDIYLLKNPLDMKALELDKTHYFKHLAETKELYTINRKEKTEEEKKTGSEAPVVGDYSRYVFANMESSTPEKQERVTLDQNEYKHANGEYKINKYKIKFSPDIINGAAGYDTFFGLQGYTQIALSDMLGNHKIYIGTNLVFDLQNSNISLQYWYLPNRVDWGFGGFHTSNFWRTTYYGLVRFRNFGANLTMSMPFSKFTRLDYSMTWYNVNLEYLQVPLPTEKVRTILPSVELIDDQIEWGMTGPADGRRYSLSLLVSPKYSENGLDFQTFKVDYRQYIKIAENYSLAFRFNGGTSQGRNPQTFFMGGVANWINPSFRYDRYLVSSIQDVYFSEFITPLRGAAFYEQAGQNFGLFNFEFRFPLIPYIQLGLPPIALGNIQGALFSDIGSAWDNTSTWKAVDHNRLSSIISGYGLGARIFFLGLLVRFDVAWRYDLQQTSKPVYYWSLGADF